jgi:hypothetical protein
MGVVVTHDLAHDLGRLSVRPVRGQPHFVHAVQNAPVHRLQSVPHVGERATDDHAHGVIEIRRAHLVFDRNLS